MIDSSAMDQSSKSSDITAGEREYRPHHFSRFALRQWLSEIGADEWTVERIDEEDGSIRYEIWSRRDGFILGLDDDLTPRARIFAAFIAGIKNEAHSLLKE